MEIELTTVEIDFGSVNLAKAAQPCFIMSWQNASVSNESFCQHIMVSLLVIEVIGNTALETYTQIAWNCLLLNYVLNDRASG